MNQFQPKEENIKAILAFAVALLSVTILYAVPVAALCGTVASTLATKADFLMQKGWFLPRIIYFNKINELAVAKPCCKNACPKI